MNGQYVALPVQPMSEPIIAKENEEDILEQVISDVSNLSVMDDKKDATVETIISGIQSVSKYPKDTQILTDIANKLRHNTYQQIVVLTGAGISVTAGIPDFRSPGTGLYHNLQKYKLPYPEAVFDITFFPNNPTPFYTLAKELWPGNFAPTPTHFFIKLLENKQILLRNFTQNIDGLERIAGIKPESIIEAHGTFATATCLECKEPYDQDFVKKAVFEDKIPMCSKKNCKGIVKPDIVFFGEGLPERFNQRLVDLKKADLLIVMGTSLQVQPFASLTGMVRRSCPRILINREKAGEADLFSSLSGGAMRFQSESNTRDVFIQGDCDDGVRILSRLMSAESELDALIQSSSSSAKS